MPALRDYPFLAPEEFAEACHELDRTYRRATLGPLRRRWRLSVCTAFNTAFFGSGPGSDYSTYVQITRPLDRPAGDDELAGALAGALAQVSLGACEDAGAAAAADPEDEDADLEDADLAAAEDADAAALPPAARAPAGRPDCGAVTYEIHLHPTYRAPCLWFALHGLPRDEPAFSIDTVFRRLVPPAYQDGLRAVGHVGGISVDYHPVTGVPSFFVHPCLLGDAMRGFDCAAQNYLMVWLGLVGGCVGLWVPKEMALV